MRDKILLVDDEPNLRMILSAMLEREDFEVFAYEGFEEAKATFNNEDIDVVLTDLNMPGINGMEVLKYCQSYSPDLPVIMITAFGTIEAAVSALKNGAFDFVLKPFDQEELFRTIRKAIGSRKRRKREPALELMTAVGVGPVALPLFGDQPETVQLRDHVQRIAKCGSNVLMLGEVGTGKRSIAYEIHRKSDRSRGPFIQIQADAIPDVFQRTELLGVEKGALPVALFSKPGAMELAQGGTLLIEEIGALGVETQNALFTAMENEYFSRIGGARRHPLDFRLIATTSRDLGPAVKAGTFHVELELKLTTESLSLKPLRERALDLRTHLAPYFVRRACQRQGTPALEIDVAALDWLARQTWPGNLGELERKLEQAVNRARDLQSRSILPEHLS
jgi:two-component system response regulator AtoC